MEIYVFSCVVGMVIKKNFFDLTEREEGKGGRERETSICSMSLCIPLLLLVHALNSDQTCNLRTSGMTLQLKELPGQSQNGDFISILSALVTGLWRYRVPVQFDALFR